MANSSSAVAEIAHVQLRSCLVNLPPVLAEAIVNAGTPAQNIIVELQVQNEVSGRHRGEGAAQHSVFVGWTGISSRRRANAPYTTETVTSKAGQATNYVEIDPVFARVLELPEGHKVSVILRKDPELVHTLNVEPLTSGDWEMIELHAAFLETNLQAQVRALPNPNFTGSKTLKPFVHPLTLHLSPTSTANVVVSSFTPAIPPTVAFAKLAPDAEVIVAPKSRTRTQKNSRTENRSTTGLSQRSTGTRSGTGSTKSRSQRAELGRNTLFLRAVKSTILTLAEDTSDQTAPTIWADENLIKEKLPKVNEWIAVSTITSHNHAGVSAEDLQKQQAQEAGEAGRPSSRIIARLRGGKHLPSTDHAILNSTLCSALGVQKGAGEVVRLELPPPMTPRNKLRSIKIFPFQQQGELSASKGLKIGGDIRTDKETAAREFRECHGPNESNGLLAGPLTDGMIIPEQTTTAGTWNGGILRFDPKSTAADGKSLLQWTVDQNRDLAIDICEEIQNPLDMLQSHRKTDGQLPTLLEKLIGFDKISDQIVTSIVHQSSVLLEGGMGSGKTSLAALVAKRLEREHLFYVSYLDCRKLTTDETRVSTIKEKLKDLFMNAWWGAQLGGRSVVIFDDLDKLCPAETELQVGGENARSRQLSEIFASMVHQYCSGSSKISVLASAIAKESLQALLVGSHVLRDIISIRAPDKSHRRDILEALMSSRGTPLQSPESGHLRASYSSDEELQEATSIEYEDEQEVALTIGIDVDFLDVAGKTDGYMPGDLVLLTSRARSEAVIRSIRHGEGMHGISISKDDFARALKGFVPISLRNVALQSSSTTFESIGGLESTRKILLETLQYPTTYAPIFAQCPLRLRSGLLLYGYPGCGKTLLASAVAGECGLNFISVKGPEILNKYIGASEKSVRDLFERAQSAKPCVLFFDEFDSIAPKRGHDSTGVTDRVVNQLLTQMDGAEGLSGVYVLAATSRPDLIDPALLRPGRLDKSLLCDMPNEQDRLGILEALSKNLKLGSSIRSPGLPGQRNLAEVARRTEGYSGADLQAVVYNAHLEAVHEILSIHKPSVQPTKHMSSKTRHLPRRELLAFQFGEYGQESNGVASTLHASSKRSQLMDREILMEQLESLKLAKRREKGIRRGQHDTDAGKSVMKEESPEPVIQWKHIEASLATTRKSINEAERTKLERIYHEFVMGRNGEMPTGQGSTQVGARSSLM